MIATTINAALITWYLIGYSCQLRSWVVDSSCSNDLFHCNAILLHCAVGGEWPLQGNLSRTVTVRKWPEAGLRAGNGALSLSYHVGPQFDAKFKAPLSEHCRNHTTGVVSVALR
jgi:hypothetical protein